MYTIITSKENEEIDDRTLDKIGIKKFGDISSIGTSMANMSLEKGGNSIEKVKRSS